MNKWMVLVSVVSALGLVQACSDEAEAPSGSAGSSGKGGSAGKGGSSGKGGNTGDAGSESGEGGATPSAAGAGGGAPVTCEPPTPPLGGEGGAGGASEGGAGGADSAGAAGMSGAPGSAGAGAAPVMGLAIAGTYSDEFDGSYEITSSSWASGGAVFHISAFDNEAMYVIALNDQDNMYGPCLWSRYDWVLDGDDLYYCTTAYDAATEQEALDQERPDDSDPANGGCSTFPWTLLTPE